MEHGRGPKRQPHRDEVITECGRYFSSKLGGAIPDPPRPRWSAGNFQCHVPSSYGVSQLWIHRTASSSGTWELRSIVLKQASRGETAALDPSVLRQTEA
jgi:hypothetical protein